LKVVLDTNVLFSGLLWGGCPDQCLKAAQEGMYELFFSDEIMVELQRTLGTKGGLDKPEISLMIEYIHEIGRKVNITMPIQAILSHPPDNRIVETAVAAGAEIIVSGDRHLLDLGRYNDIEILSPRDFINFLTE
jgi:uncharacterized protein